MGTLDDGFAVANTFLEAFPDVSRFASWPSAVRHVMELQGSSELDFSFFRAENYNVSFAMKDLCTAFSICGNPSLGPDGVPYIMLWEVQDESLNLSFLIFKM